MRNARLTTANPTDWEHDLSEQHHSSLPRMHTSSPHGHPTTRRLSDPSSHHVSTHRRQQYPPTTFTPSPQHEARVNPHQRRLQLRNSAFGTHISAQRLGARFSSIFHGNEEPQTAPVRDREQENQTPHRGSVRSTRSNYSLTSSLGILNEISNSTHIPSLRKRPSIPIYEDNPERPLLERSPATPDSQFQEASSTIQSPLSPLGLAYIQGGITTMRLREVSGNERRQSPPLSSPLLSANSKGRRRTTGMRHASFEAAEYIDHIETQLEQVKQAMHSPKSGKPIHEKMRTLVAENARLQTTINELESSFEARVKSSVEHMTAGEGEMRRKLRCMEDDLRERDLKIEQLEYEHDQARLDEEIMETLKATIDRLEGEKRTLEDANSSMEKRNEILSEMLAFSPTKSNQGCELVSPTRNGGRLPRPVSMMSWTRFPSSPTWKQSSRPSSIVTSPTTISPGGYFNSRNVLELELEHPCNDADSGLGESCSTKSPITTSTRRSTSASQASISPSAWGLPLPISPVEGGGTIRPIQKRKPRRFMTGSTQLKPLLLPSMAAESAGLTSPRSPTRHEIFEAPTPIDQTVFSHDLEGSLTAPKRDVSHESIDPTISFLSHPFDGVSLTEEESAVAEIGSSPPHLSVLDELSLSAKSSSLEIELGGMLFLQEGFSGDIEEETGVEAENDEDEGESADLVDSPERRILFTADQSRSQRLIMAESVPVNNIRSSLASQERLMDSIEALMQTTSPSHEARDSSPNPRKRRRTSQSSPSSASIRLEPASNVSSNITAGSTGSPSALRPPDLGTGRATQEPDHRSTEYKLEVNSSTLANRAASQRASSSPINEKRLSRTRSPFEILQRTSTSSTPLTVVTIRSIYGTLSRYTTYISEFKSDPWALARRVIANAWSSNWKRFGKLSWWVLGIFIPGGQGNYAAVNGWDWDSYDGEAVADRFCTPESLITEAMAIANSEPCSSPGKRSVRFETHHDNYRTQGSKVPAKPALKGSKEKQTGLGKSLYLWGKFSLAIMLAVGGAVLKGPAEMLKDCHTRGQVASSPQKPLVSTRYYDSREIPEDEILQGSPDSHEGNISQDLPKRPRIFSLGTDFNFNKSARPTSSLFTFGSPNGDNFWDEDEDDPDWQLDHYHQPDYGEDNGADSGG
jgi:hypothetical protein